MSVTALLRVIGLVVAAAACVHTSAVRAQSAALIIQEAATQRECAEIAKAAASRPGADSAVPQRCRSVAVISEKQTAAWVLGLGLLAAVLVGGALFLSKAVRVKGNPRR